MSVLSFYQEINEPECISPMETLKNGFHVWSCYLRYICQKIQLIVPNFLLLWFNLYVSDQWKYYDFDCIQ